MTQYLWLVHFYFLWIIMQKYTREKEERLRGRQWLAIYEILADQKVEDTTCAARTPSAECCRVRRILLIKRQMDSVTFIARVRYSTVAISKKRHLFKVSLRSTYRNALTVQNVSWGRGGRGGKVNVWGRGFKMEIVFFCAKTTAWFYR